MLLKRIVASILSPMVRNRNLVTRVLFAAFFSLWLCDPPVFAADLEKVDVRYSADDSICKPLAALYSKLNHKHVFQDDPEGGERLEVSLNWEDVYSVEFAAMGLKPEVPVKDISYFHDGRRPPATWTAAFYPFHSKPDDPPQLLYLQDVPFGGHSDFRTSVWLVKPGVKQPDHPPLDILKDVPPGIDATEIELGVLFSSPRPPQDSYPAIIGSYPASGSDDPALLGPGSSVIQRIFEWRGQTVVIARGPGPNGILYKFDKSAGISDICHFMADATLHNRRDRKKGDAASE